MDKKEKRSKLVKQIFKFGIVGGLAFLIDFVVYTMVLSVFNWVYDYLIAGLAGFTISLIFNYLASMAFVFKRKENVDRRKEFTVFLLLSLVGMGLNTLTLWICVDIIYENIAGVQMVIMLLLSFMQSIGVSIANAGDMAALIAKFFATGVVMVYNFISRKIFLEKKDDDENEIKIQEIIKESI